MNFILAPILLFLLSGAILAENWKLQPLKYNNPDLIVDLGVGLLAWPLPMDYDGDGDLDLIVSCPDKPSNGLYFFENPTQDSSVNLPVFKPGVHIAKTGHNIQISYVKGEARILRENREYIDFRTNQFSRLDKIYPPSKNHKGNGRTRANM